MKRLLLYLIITLCTAGLVHADQTIQSVQQTLKDRGFYYGAVTGEKSAETTAAIRRYQIRNGLQVSGDINQETLRSLNSNSNSAASSKASSKLAAAPSNNARPAETPPLDQNPSSQPPSPPDRQPEMNPNFPGALYQAAPRRINKRAVVAEVQRQLMSRGYYRGSIDGKYGRVTAYALGTFQLQSGLPPTGRLDMTTLDALGLSNPNIAYTQPAPRQYETWIPVTKFKHGQWKVKWKKYHRPLGNEDGDEDQQANSEYESQARDY